MGKILLAVFTLFCFTACTTLQPLADSQAITIQQQVKAGDTVELERMDGTRQTLKVESVSADRLVGMHDNKRYEVPLSDIRTIGTRTMTARDKLWATVGVVAAIGGLIALAGGGDGGGSGGGY